MQKQQDGQNSMVGRSVLLPGLLLMAVCLCQSALGAGRWVVHEQTESLEVFAEYATDVSAIVRELDHVSAELRQVLKQPEAAQNVQVILFKSPASYRASLAGKIPAALQRRAIFYKHGSLLQVYAYRHADVMTDLRHEYTHALLHQALPYIPLWIDEGLAEFLEERPERRTKSARLSGMKWRCRSGWQPDLKRLEAIPSAAAMTSADYRDSWAWVHFLLNGSDETRGLFRDYLAAVSAGEAPGAFSDWSGQRSPQTGKAIGSYFRKFRFALR